MKKIALAFALLLGSVAGASAACVSPAVMHDFPGAVFNMSLATGSDGNCASKTVLDSTTAEVGTPVTGVTQGTGGVGLSGWLSGIYNALNQTFSTSGAAGSWLTVWVKNALNAGRAVSSLSSPVVPTPALTTWHLIAANSTNATSVKASAATLFSCQLGGIAGPAFLKIYNKASAPTLSLATPVNSAFSTLTTGGTLAAATYFYRVSATDANGETLASTETSQATTGTTSTVTVNWGAVTGATGYKVYGRTTGAELLIAAVGNVTTYTDTGSITPSGALPAANTTADTPVKTLIIPVAGTAANGAGSNISFGPGGLTLATGFATAVTGVITDADTTAVAASSFAINCDYE